jgi:hypothetical protein
LPTKPQISPVEILSQFSNRAASRNNLLRPTSPESSSSTELSSSPELSS